MTKFMILYSSPINASDLMSNATAEQMKASMDEWIKWREEANKTLKIELGMPLQAINKVTNAGVTDSVSQVSGYSIVEGETKEAVLNELKIHPHLKREGASIDVLEVLQMPGVDA